MAVSASTPVAGGQSGASGDVAQAAQDAQEATAFQQAIQQIAQARDEAITASQTSQQGFAKLQPGG